LEEMIDLDALRIMGVMFENN